MKQARMQFRRPEKTVKRTGDDFDSKNLNTAREVLDSPEKYGGDEAITVVWARLVVERLEGDRCLMC